MFRIFFCVFFLFVSSFSFAEEVLEKALRNQPTRDFIFNMLSSYWSRSQLPQERLAGIFDLLERYAAEGELAMLLLHEKYPDMVESGSLFSLRYREARKHKFNAYAALIAPYIQGQVMLDFGAENLQLTSALVSLNPHIQKAYATDIFPCQTPSNDPKVAFLLQDSPTKTPFSKESVDTILLSTVLHHIEPQPRRELLAHFFEILKPGGRIILVEDSFPEKKYAVDFDKDSLEKQFSLLSQEEKIDVIAFLDWWGNRVMKNRAEIPLPYTFKSEEAWVNYFEDFGFRPLEIHFLGFPPINTHMVSPKALMIFEKSVPPSFYGENGPVFQRGGAIFEARGSLPSKGVLLHVSVGGSKILVEGVNSQGHSIYRSIPFKWRSALNELNGLSAREWIIKQLLREIKEGIEVCGKEQIEQIVLSWAGPVVEGKVIGPNIAGFGFVDLTNEELRSGGVDLLDILAENLPSYISIAILNDADDEALAEFFSKGIRDGTLLIVGTGIGSGLIAEGKVYFGPPSYEGRMGEIGHHIVFDQDTSRYEYYGKESRGKILSGQGEGVTERLSGPALARRFLHFAFRENYHEMNSLLSYLNDQAIIFSKEEIELFFREGQCAYSLEERVLMEISEKARRGDMRALRFIRATGFELGAAFAAFATSFPEASFLKRVHLAGSVGCFFGRGGVGKEGEMDPFLEAVKRGFVDGRKAMKVYGDEKMAVTSVSR